jgi:signal peptidase II
MKFPFIVIGIGLIILDQISKWWVEFHYPFFIVQNNGIIWGLGEHWPQYLIILIYLICLIILFFFLWQFLKTKIIWGQLGCVIILAGGLSNLISRITQGYIIDFIKLGFWPAFNCADILIIGGAILYGYSFLRDFQRKSHTP